MRKLDIINGRVGVGFTVFCGKILPPSVGHKVADIIVRQIAKRKDSELIQTIRRNQLVVSNGNLSEDEMDQRVFHILRHNAYGLYDFYHYLTNHKRLDRIIEILPGARNFIDTYLNQPEGCLLVGPHFTGFDIMALSLAVEGLRGQILSVPDPSGGYRWQNELRSREGWNVTPISIQALREAQKSLSTGQVVITGVDRPYPETKFKPRFFGVPAQLPVFYIRLAMHVGVPLRVILGRFTEDGVYHIDISDPVPLDYNGSSNAVITKNAEAVLSVVEQAISKEPDQWGMFYPVWEESDLQAIQSGISS